MRYSKLFCALPANLREALRRSKAVALQRFVCVCICVCVSFDANAQLPPECDTVFQREFAYDPINKDSLNDEININFLALIPCGLDSIDIQIFSGSLLGMLYRSLVIEKMGEQITYKDVFIKMMQFKYSPSYDTVRVAAEIFELLAKRPAFIKNWKSDKLLLKEMGMRKLAIKSIHTFLKTHSEEGWTWRELFIAYYEDKEAY